MLTLLPAIGSPRKKMYSNFLWIMEENLHSLIKPVNCELQEERDLRIIGLEQIEIVPYSMNNSVNQVCLFLKDYLI